MLEDVDPSMVPEATGHQLDLREAAQDLEVKRRRPLRPSLGQQEVLLAELASNMKLLRSVVSSLLQVSETAGEARPPRPYIPSGESSVQICHSGSPEQLKQSCFQTSGQEVGVHTFHPQSSGQVTRQR